MVYYLGLPYQSHSNAYFEWDSEPAQMRMFGLSSNSALGPENLPDSATRWRGKQTPDVFPMPGLNAVNERFRELVERFEPGAHLFHPITLKEKDGTRIAGPHYIFCARIALDCVLMQKSGIVWELPEDEFPPYPTFHHGSWETHNPSHPKSRSRQEAKHGILASAAARGVKVEWPKHLYVSAQAIEGHHIWTGSRAFTSNLWVSDAFFSAFEKAKIKWLTSHAYGFEIDEPWLPECEMAPILEWHRTRKADVS